MGKPLVAIVGRPNVGKSTLFNRIVGSRTAVVEAHPGVTRDRLQQDTEWNNTAFSLIDTGGIDVEADDNIAQQVREQAYRAVETADLVLFVVDANTGLLPPDLDIAQILRPYREKIILVVNKVDDFTEPPPMAEFFPLGLGEPFPISAAGGLNIGDLLDEIVSRLPGTTSAEETEAVRIAVVGRPNVGKSSLINRILGEERVIVSNIPGTTRDAVDTIFHRGNIDYVFIDTAGIRRRSRITESIEKYSILRSQKAIERADIVLVIIDAAEGITQQDKRIAGMAEKEGKATIIVLNKWDLVSDKIRNVNSYLDGIRSELAFINYAPILHISALTGYRVEKVFDMINSVIKEYQKQIATSTLNKILRDAFLAAPPPAHQGKRLKFLYATQVGIKPPQFLLFVNNPALIAKGYRRYLENQLRRYFGFEGTPVRMFFRRRDK
ncbi:MAG: ribosome biogenesis GTPase Der [Peptococcaceae bacterium]|nr:ribosome biogenesis GTPase Der [Peptococcaceae bacterium]